MLRTIALGITLVILATSLQEAEPAAPPQWAEFPPHDFTLAYSANNGWLKALAARLLRDAPDSVETLVALGKARNPAGAIEVLQRIVDRRSERLVEAVEAFRSASVMIRGDDEAARRNQQALREIIEQVRKKLPALPREDAARIERVMIIYEGELSGDFSSWPRRLAKFAEEYAGTEAALLAQVDAIAAPPVSRQVLDALDAVVAAHPGTRAAAKALYEKGYHLHSGNALGTVFPRDADPIDRFRLVLAVVRELQGGKYPPSEWVSKAPSLVTGFFVPEKAPIAPSSLDEMIGVFQDFAAKHFVLDDLFAPDRNGIGYLVTTTIGSLYERKGEREAGVERTLDALERSVAEPSGVKYLRALFFLQPRRGESPSELASRRQRGREALRSLAAEGKALYHRRALATLAALDFDAGAFASARDAFRKYVSAYPDTAWTWVARLRTGQCEEALGNVGAAVDAYLHAAGAHADMPLARVLGAAYAARIYEQVGELRKAIESYERALEGWDNSYGVQYATGIRRSPVPDDPFVRRTDPSALAKNALAPLIAQLKASAGLPGGALLESGRALLAAERPDEAVQQFGRVLSRHPQSPLVRQARSLLHLARVERALKTADVYAAQPDERRAVSILEDVTRQPHDFGVTAAKVMLATLLLKQGRHAEAEQALGLALAEWHARQPVKRPATPLEQDAAEIRRVIFLPRGGEIYGQDRWNAFSWPTAASPYLLVDANLKLTMHDGDVLTVTVAEPLAHAANVLFFETRQIELLERMILRLGGAKRREPGHIMETPNQPVGDATHILALWSRFFPARPGHWFGWELVAYPVITGFQFMDAQRTRAAAKVTIGYSGATVELEKQDGKWIARRLSGRWIT